MARKENKAKTNKASKKPGKNSMNDNREYDFESGDNPAERERSSGSNEK
ncbi:MAG: hypothetical protein HC905_13660 [Bacteroidales bacterium]|nr:hypothetical protein [Bacteroidales bacterium]